MNRLLEESDTSWGERGVELLWNRQLAVKLQSYMRSYLDEVERPLSPWRFVQQYIRLRRDCQKLPASPFAMLVFPQRVRQDGGMKQPRPRRSKRHEVRRPPQRQLVNQIPAIPSRRRVWIRVRRASIYGFDGFTQAS